MWKKEVLALVIKQATLEEKRQKLCQWDHVEASLLGNSDCETDVKIAASS